MINKKINRLYTAFLIIGITITSIGLYTTIKTLDSSNKVDTIGTITSIVSTSNDTPDVYVTYNVDGKRYTSVMSGYSSTFYEGKKIDIYYMKNDPNIIGNKKLELLILLFPFVGLIFLLIGGINIFKIISNKKKKERLIKTGTVIEATYIETNTNFNLRVLGRNPSNIICEYDDPISKNTYRFKSEILWYDPTLYIGDNDIYTFNVYVNKNNMKDYYVDIEKLIDRE